MLIVRKSEQIKLLVIEFNSKEFFSLPKLTSLRLVFILSFSFCSGGCQGKCVIYSCRSKKEIREPGLFKKGCFCSGNTFLLSWAKITPLKQQQLSNFLKVLSHRSGQITSLFEHGRKDYSRIGTDTRTRLHTSCHVNFKCE